MSVALVWLDASAAALGVSRERDHAGFMSSDVQGSCFLCCAGAEGFSGFGGTSF